jgi:hypothetical protein
MNFQQRSDSLQEKLTAGGGIRLSQYNAILSAMDDILTTARIGNENQMLSKRLIILRDEMLQLVDDMVRHCESNDDVTVRIH